MSVPLPTSMINMPKTDKENGKKREPDERLWLDKECLEPIISVPGCSRLCNACLRVLQRSVSHRSHRYTRHVQYWTTLSSSADRGCHLCIHLRNHWEKYRGNDRATEHIMSRAHADEFQNGRRVFFYGGNPACRDIQPKTIRFELSNPACDPIKTIGDYSKCSVSTSSPECQSLARCWLLHCMKSHALCRSDTGQSKKIPARLIEINLTDQVPTLRIIETSGRPPGKRLYMTLSYCWGNSHFLTLQTKNEQQLKNGFTLESLPIVFQDAIYIAGWFQINYLWIDSLCILQDSHNDWISESYKMRDIYRGSFLTIAATGATDPFRGCFRDRNPSLVEPIKYRVPNEIGEYITIIDGDSLKEAIYSSPLSKRAWAFQERLLSPRVLHFGENQLLWECNEMSACETCPGGIQPYISRFWKVYPSPSIAKGQLMARHKDFLGDVWTPIVCSYSKGALTKFSDKCLAISGIAEKAQSLYRGTYVAGLWRENLEVQLLWCINDDPSDRPMARCKRPTTYVAPSWSWLSVDGPIIFQGEHKLHLALHILDLKLELSNNNPFGMIKGGWIQARGWLSAGTWKAKEIGRDGEEPWLHRTLRSIRGRRFDVRNWVEMDTAEETEEVICLIVGANVLKKPTDLGYGSTYGLLLAKTGANADEYRRIGMFWVEEWPTEKDLRPFFQHKLSGKWRTRPKTTFTIV